MVKSSSWNEGRDADRRWSTPIRKALAGSSKSRSTMPTPKLHDEAAYQGHDCLIDLQGGLPSATRRLHQSGTLVAASPLLRKTTISVRPLTPHRPHPHSRCGRLRSDFHKLFTPERYDLTWSPSMIHAEPIVVLGALRGRDGARHVQLRHLSSVVLDARSVRLSARPVSPAAMRAAGASAVR